MSTMTAMALVRTIRTARTTPPRTAPTIMTTHMFPAPIYSGPVVRFGFGGFHGDHGRWATTAGRTPVIGNPGAWQGRAGGAFSGRMSANVGAGATPAVGMGRGFGGGGAGRAGGGHAR
jgi:hypothetical protein